MTKIPWKDEDYICLNAPTHLDVETCPTYYDGCNCTVDALVFNIERADKADGQLVDFARRIKKVLCKSVSLPSDFFVGLKERVIKLIII